VSRLGSTWPGPTATWRPPRGSSTHGPTRSLRWPWCVLWPTPGLWLATRWRRSERGYGSERRGRSNLRDAFPLVSHPVGVARAGGVVCHLLGSAAVAVRAGGAPQCLRPPWGEYASKSATCPAAPAEVTKPSWNPLQLSPPGSIRAGTVFLPHRPFFLPPKRQEPSDKVRSANGASVGTAALGAVIYSGAGAGFSGDLRAIVL
jgi:hypothetical protein